MSDHPRCEEPPRRRRPFESPQARGSARRADHDRGLQAGYEGTRPYPRRRGHREYADPPGPDPRTLDEYLVLVLDPMLATGGSLSATIYKLKEEGATWISCLHAVAAVPGVERVSSEHPDVTFYAAAVDPELDDRSFIVPGLGDAGDRLYGTL